MTDLIFLMCSERSGSNLLTKIFDAHPEVCGPGTAHLADSLLPELHRYLPADSESWEALIADARALLQARNSPWKRNFEIDELRAAASEGDAAGLIRHVYAEEALAHRKGTVLVKENRIHEFAGFLRTEFPAASYVYMYRDPRDMAASWQESHAIRGGVVRAAATWERDQRRFLAMRDSLIPSTTVPIVSYEDLVYAAEPTLKRVCGELGLEFDRAMLAHHGFPDTQRHAAAAADWANVARPVFSSSAGAFGSRLSTDEIKHVETVCAETMGTLGYRRRFEPLDAAEASRIHARLSAAEPHEKPRFAKISPGERARRGALDQARARIRTRSSRLRLER